MNAREFPLGDYRSWSCPRLNSTVSTKIVYTDRIAVSTKIVETMSPAQCRAGRALLEITQTQLAASAGLGLSTVVDFEKGRRQVSSESIELIFRALTLAGVEFIDENGGGPGVRLRKRQRAKQPRWWGRAGEVFELNAAGAGKIRNNPVAKS
jgi:transcriptional regulator with XRE-family HTH domain